MTCLKTAIVVQGRFHAFDLARALLERGHEVTVFTNYPSWASARFGVPRGHVRSFVSHGISSRAIGMVGQRHVSTLAEPSLHRAFGSWAARQLGKEHWDVIHCWSGVSEELLSVSPKGPTLRLLMRGSAHIAVQNRLLQDEERRTGVTLDRPSDWMVEREIREYRLADHIAALSTFARESFLSEGVAPDRVSTLLLGVDLRAFRPGPEVIERRCARIRAGEPLRVLYVGNLSLQKGMWDLAAVAREMRGRPVEFRLVGATTPEMHAVPPFEANVHVLGKMPQSDLPDVYSDADIFLFPTIQDGYPVVLAQAKASALPILVSSNCSGPDVIRHGEDGWVLPIRDPRAFSDRLAWCLANRDALAAMVLNSYERFIPRDWSDVAADFGRMARSLLAQKGTV